MQPNDPAVDRLLKAVAAVLRTAGLPDSLNGYESKSCSRSYELASAIWSAVVEMGVTYAFPPANFEISGQKVRSPSIIRDGGLATCLDTALLFAAALEQAGLDPLIVLVKEHAFAGVWLQPQKFTAFLTEDASELRKALASKEMVVFETTLATSAAPAGFARVMAEAERLLDPALDGDFHLRAGRAPRAHAEAPAAGAPVLARSRRLLCGRAGPGVPVRPGAAATRLRSPRRRAGRHHARGDVSRDGSASSWTFRSATAC